MGNSFVSAKWRFCDFLFLFISIEIAQVIILKKWPIISFAVLAIFNIFVLLFIRFDEQKIIFKARGIFKKSFLVVLSLLVFAFYNYINTKFSSQMPYDGADCLIGKLVVDSNLSKSGGSLFEVEIENGFEGTELEFRTSGVVTIFISKNEIRAVSRQRCKFIGIKKISEGFYSADSFEILNSGRLFEIRKKFLMAAEKRILKLNNFFRTNSDYNAHLLALRLFSARLSGEENEITNLAKKTGLEFIFALSGMHLSLFALLIGKILRMIFSKRYSKILSLIFLTAYFFLVSRSQSFIRAFMSFVFSFFFPFHVTLVFSFVVQLILFPQGCCSLAFDYSYCALCGVVVASNMFDNIFKLISNKHIAKYFSLSLSCILFSSLVSLMEFGSFTIIGILISPIVSVFAGIMAICAMIFILFPAFLPVSLICRLSYLVIKYLLKSLSLLAFSCSWAGFLTILCIFAVVIYILGKRNKKIKAHYIEILKQ